MKRYFLIIMAALFLSGISFTQIKFGQKGTIEIGGNAGYSSSTEVQNGSTGSSTSNLIFNPFAGYFVIDNVQVGLNPYFSTAKNNGITTTEFDLLAAGDYYFTFSGKEKQHPYVGLLAGYSNIKSGNLTQKGYVWGAELGVKVNFSENLLYNFGLNYRRFTVDQNDISGRVGFDNVGLVMGLSFLL